MRRRISLLITAVILALTLSVGGAGAAFGDPPPWQGNDKQFQKKCQGPQDERHKNCKNFQD